MGIILGLSKIAGASDSRMSGASALSVIPMGADKRAVVFVSSRFEDKVTKVGLTSDGTFKVERSIVDGTSGELRGAGDSDITMIDDTPFLLTAASFDNAVTVSEIGRFGRMFPEIHIQDDVVFDDPEEGVITPHGGHEMSLFNADSIEAFKIDGADFFVVGGSFDDGVSLFSFGDDGESALLDNQFDTEAMHLDGIDDVAHLSVGGEDYIIAVSPNEQGISVMRITDGHILLNTDNVTSNPLFSLGRLTNVETANIGDKGFVVVGGFGSTAVTVFEMNADGQLDLAHRLSGDDGGNIGRVFSLEVFEVDGQTYVAAGGDRGAISVFRMDKNGDLTIAAEFEGVNASRAGETTDIAVQQFGDKTLLIASGQDGDGIASFRFFDDMPGKMHIGDAGNNILKGREKGDLLIGDEGNDRLKGKSGHDRILDGEGKDLLWGGSGRDVFEFGADGKQDKVQDFEDGRDLIDLSDAVNRFADLDIEQISDGVVGITHGDELLIVKGFGGSDVTLDMLDETDFIFAEDQFL